jgi:hypothetical protein
MFDCEFEKSKIREKVGSWKGEVGNGWKLEGGSRKWLEVGSTKLEVLLFDSFTKHSFYYSAK